MDNILLLMASAQIKCALPFQQGRFCYLLYEGEHMSIKKEIDRAVKRIAALDKSTAPKTPVELERIITDVEESYRSAKYDFSNATSMTLSQNGKKRLVKQYDDLYSSENVLCYCIKQILDRVFKIKYPNRNRISRDLFSTLSAAIQMSDFTIVRFDFKQYFNSISSIYVFEKYLMNDLLNRYEMDLVLVDHIGYDYKSLVNLCKQIGINNIDVNGKRRGYGTLVRDYLIKVRVGY